MQRQRDEHDRPHGVRQPCHPDEDIAEHLAGQDAALGFVPGLQYAEHRGRHERAGHIRPPTQSTSATT